MVSYEVVGSFSQTLCLLAEPPRMPSRLHICALGRRGHGQLGSFEKQDREQDIKMSAIQQVVVMIFGGVLAVVGIYLFATDKAAGKKDKASKITLLGISVELSTPSLIIFVVGCGLFISPFFLGQKVKPDSQASHGKSETN